MKTFYNKKTFFLMLISMWMLIPHFSYSQSTCQTAFAQVPNSTYQRDTIQSNDSVFWISFVADTTTMVIIADSIPSMNYHYLHGIELYSGSCNSMNLLSSQIYNHESETFVSLLYDQFVVNNTYYAKIIMTGDSNAYFGVGITEPITASYNWNVDVECPCACNILHNPSFDINTITTFSTTNPIGASPFKNGNVCAWKGAIGSPKIRRPSMYGWSINPPWDPAHTHAFIAGGVSPYDGIERTEGIYQIVRLKQGVSYRMTFKYMNDWINHYGVNHLRFLLTNDSIGLGFLQEYIQKLPANRPSPPYQELFDIVDTHYGWLTPYEWVYKDTTFTVNNDYHFLLIYLNFNNQQPRISGNTRVLLDSLKILPTEDFSLYGLPSDTTICMGDSANLYGWAHYTGANPPFSNSTFSYKWFPEGYMGATHTNITKVSPPMDKVYYFYAENEINCWKIDSVTIHVTQPQASFVVQNDSICQDDIMYFIDNSSCTNGIVSWSWDFGDGKSSSQINPSHLYTQSGIFNVTLTTIDLNGDLSTYSKSVYVKPLPEIPQISGLNNNCDQDSGYYNIGNIQSGVSYDWYVDGTLVQSNTSNISLLWSNYFPNTNHYIDISVIAMLDSCTNSNTYRVFACCNQPGTIAYNNDTIYSNTTITTPSIVVNGTLVIKADVSFDAINSIDIKMGPMAKIEVENGKDLSFDFTNMQAGCEYMWDGIYMDGANSQLEVKNYSSIADAIYAINSDNGAKIKITNSSLGSNLYGITVKNASLTSSPIDISKSHFYGKFALGVKPFVSYYSKSAIRAKDVSNISIGDISNINNTNTFDGFENAIIIENANSEIFNNSFTNSIEKSIKIKHSLLPMTPYTTTIGGENNSSGTRSNSFTDVYNAIFVQYTQNLSIMNNSFTNVGTWNTIELRDVSYSNILVNSNTFSEVKMALRSYNAYSSDITISDNTVTKSVFGFGVYNTHWGEVKKLLIRNNDISLDNVKIYSRGIQVINIKGKPDIFAPMGTPNLKRAVIDSNRINISHTTIPNIYTFGVVGIDVQNSILAYIQDNILEKNQPDYDNSNAHKYIGIKIENSPNAVFCNNKMTKFGYGVECSGSSPNSRLVKTDIGISNYGINLNNAHIGNQGFNIGNGYTYDNIWYNGMYGKYKIIGNVTTATDWYYRSGNISYSPNPSSPIWNLSLTQLSSPNSVGCGIDTDPSYNKEPFETNDYFEAIVDNNFVYDTLETQSNYYSRRYVYTIMKNNEELRDQLFALNSIYAEFFDEMESSIINDFETQNNYIADAQYANAQAILNAMVATGDFDYFEFQVDTIFLNTWAQDNLDLSSTQYGLLRKIADGDNMLFGPAVYTARVMVGMENMGSTARIGHFADKQTYDLEHKIKVFPNPTSGLIEIESSIKLENATMEIYSLIGKRIKSVQLNNKHSSVDLSDLSQGVYIYRIINNNSIVDINKIIINK